MIDIPKHKKLILFDGVCNLCNTSIQYIIKHDKHNTFIFAPLQGLAGLKLIKHYNIDTKKTDSIILYSRNDTFSYKSTAALKIASKLGFPRNMAVVFYIIPPFIRNWVYGFVAKNRYKWFGKQEKCLIPTQELKAKFLD